MRNIAILGMHRSGTSMVAGALASAGVHVGEPEALLARQEDNPHGFWERRDVVALNDEILASAGASWYNPSRCQGQTHTRANHSTGIRSVLAQLPTDRSWLIKDPRLAVTWPQWQQALADAVVVFVYRDPVAVAVSLRRRNGFPLALGFALWEYYNQSALTALQGRDAVCVSFESIAADPGTGLARLVAELAGLGVGFDPCADFVTFDQGLGQSRNESAANASALLSESQQRLARYCEALCSGANLPERPAIDAGLLPRLDDLAAAMAPLARVLETRIELDEITRLCEQRTAERDESLQHLRQLEAEHDELAAAHSQEVARHGQLRQQHRAEGDAYRAQLAALREKVEALFVELSRAYGNLLAFEQSLLAGIWRFTGACYKLFTRRRGVNSSYDDVLVDARAHFNKHGLTGPEPTPRTPGRASLLRDVIAYIVRNPAGSVRSFSLPRLKRAAAVFMTSRPEDLEVWINSRFPDNADKGLMAIEHQLDASLDQLRLVFPRAGQPLVSIVVPVFNEYRVTMRCLKSLLENTADVPYEVIIADDCSTDLTATLGDRVDNITVVRGEKNRGFLRNCNAAATAARGRYILFLNNDTYVCPGWLAPLVDTLESDASVGIVGPRLLFEDGRLQEAGAIMWRDGSAWNFGRMDDPDKPEYNYRREVDYVSGACLLVRAQLWQQLAGFDERYVPAYYEDSDLAFAARDAGYKVVYQPLSVVFHFEGLSNGTDLGSGVKQHQVSNQARFREKWQRELDAFHFPNAEHVFLARDRSRHQRCVLFIDHYVPHYDKDAGSRSTFMYVQLMLELGYRVLFLGANFFPHKPYTQTLQQLGVEVLVGEHMARNQDRWLRDNAAYIDVIYLHRPHVAEQFLPSLERLKTRPRIVFFGHDLHYLRIGREYGVVGDEQLRRSAEKWRRREYAVFDRVDKIYYPSQVEVDEILAQRPDLDVRAIPLYAFDEGLAATYDFAATSDILFVGGFNHPPNVDAVCWFVESVLPLVRQHRPGIRLHVVGSNPTEAVQDLHGEHVLVYGYLSDEELDSLYRQVRQVVVPLRFGAGVKGKVLEAIRKNLPVVTTSIGAEGIPAADSVLTVADSAEAFAASVVALDAGDPGALAKLAAYGDWLAANFGKAGAARIVLEDFGPPVKEVGTVQA